jgi:endonuclease G
MAFGTEHRLAIRLFTAWVLFLALACQARIGVEYQMQLGNPSGATADTNNHTHYLIQRRVMAEDYNDTRRVPNWVSWNLTASDVGSSGRGNFLTDTNLPANFYWVKTSDYTYSGYDRGHMCPSADRTDSVTNNDHVFFMSNIIPQTPDNNQGVWADLETECRTLAAAGNELLITSRPRLRGRAW